jgi:V/A-type H+-transporting ATPase subunit F
MRLAGINGIFINEKKAIAEALKNAVKDPEIGIILLTENLSFLIPEEIHNIRVDKHMPIITIYSRPARSKRPEVISRTISKNRSALKSEVTHGCND